MTITTIPFWTRSKDRQWRVKLATFYYVSNEIGELTPTISNVIAEYECASEQAALTCVRHLWLSIQTNEARALLDLDGKAIVKIPSPIETTVKIHLPVFPHQTFVKVDLDSGSSLLNLKDRRFVDSVGSVALAEAVCDWIDTCRSFTTNVADLTLTTIINYFETLNEKTILETAHVHICASWAASELRKMLSSHRQTLSDSEIKQAVQQIRELLDLKPETV